MNPTLLTLTILFGTALAGLGQGRAPKTTKLPPPAPPPVTTAPAQEGSAQTFIYEQKPAAGRPALVTPEQAQTIINRFKETYVKLGSPRILIYVNRDLIDDESGLKLSARSEQFEAVRGDVRKEFKADEKAASQTPGSSAPSKVTGNVVLGDLNTGALDQAPGKGAVSGEVEKVSGKNTFRVRERKAAPLADRQTVRDVERLMGRPLRMAGATLVDQRVAVQLLADKPLHNFAVPTEGEAARKDREAVTKQADVVLEVLISSRQITVPEISGDRIYSVPDIQATAIRLSDSKVLGQATSSDLVGEGPQAARVARNFGVREITEATALSLMEDMMPWP